MSTRLGTLPGLGLALLIAGCGEGDVALPAATTSTPTDFAAPSSPLTTRTSPAATRTTIPPTTRTPSPSPTYPANVTDRPDFSPLEPATYYIEPESIPVRVLYTIPADGWSSWIGTFKPEQGPDGRGRHVAISIMNVTNLLVDACDPHSETDPPVGPTVDDLATALAELPPFLVTKAPRDVTFHGFRGKYLELTVPDLPVLIRGEDVFWPECGGYELKSWIAPSLSFAYYGYHTAGQIEAFWILDVDGSRLVIEANWTPDSPNIAEMRRILDSIEIVPK